MVEQHTTNWIRFGILALPLSGLLTLVGLIGRYNIPNPRLDPKVAVQTANSTGYFSSQFGGSILGLILLIFGVIALAAYLANTPVRGLALSGMVLSITGITLLLTCHSVATYVLPVIGQAYLNGQQDSLTIVSDIWAGSVNKLFIPVVSFYTGGFLLFAIAIWRSGVLPKGAAISLGLHAPLVSSFIRPQPNLLTIVEALLFILGGAMIALSVFREPSAEEAEEAEAETERLQENEKSRD